MKANLKAKCIVILLTLLLLAGCTPAGGGNGGGNGDGGDNPPEGWNGESITFNAQQIAGLSSGTPFGMAEYQASTDTAFIYNIDTSFDNYGGISTPSMSFNFSKALIFRMDVVSCYTQYIVKLAVEGVSEYYYVLSDEGETGVISINVVDSMLSDKYRLRNTQPDPGYSSGWHYRNQTKKCQFFILAKGPDGERQTAELEVRSISIYNNQEAVTGLTISGSGVSNNKLSALKNSAAVSLSAAVAPSGSSQEVIWKSQNPSIAQVSDSGVVSFVGVGKTSITAQSLIDQSKSAIIEVDVLSGYESPALLKDRLGQLTYGGSEQSASEFNDLFNTTWAAADQMQQKVRVNSVPSALDVTVNSNSLLCENYFNPADSAQVSEAESLLIGSDAALKVSLAGNNSEFTTAATATVYRNVDGKLYTQTLNALSETLNATYARKSGSFTKVGSYIERAIVVWSGGAVTKLEIEVKDLTLTARFAASDLATGWHVPDVGNPSQDFYLLNPAIRTLEGGEIKLKQNSIGKYKFGGIVSDVLQLSTSKQNQIVVDVSSVNQRDSFIITMWEIKIIYYNEAGQAQNIAAPLKLAASNQTGVHTITFSSNYPKARLYLVVNGSDIGAQFADAEIKVRSLKLQTVN